MDISAGEPLIDLLALAYRSSQPVLLTGRHGVGKSQILAQAAGTSASGTSSATSA